MADRGSPPAGDVPGPRSAPVDGVGTGVVDAVRPVLRAQWVLIRRVRIARRRLATVDVDDRLRTVLGQRRTASCDHIRLFERSVLEERLGQDGRNVLRRPLEVRQEQLVVEGELSVRRRGRGDGWLRILVVRSDLTWRRREVGLDLAAGVRRGCLPMHAH